MRWTAPLILLAVTLFIQLHAGFIETSPKLTAISTVKEMEDSHWVIMEGFIEKRIDKDDYLFKDGKNEVVVEIDEELWQGRDVGPETRIRIYGEVNQTQQEVKVEARKLVILPRI